MKNKIVSSNARSTKTTATKRWGIMNMRTGKVSQRFASRDAARKVRRQKIAHTGVGGYWKVFDTVRGTTVR